MLPRQRKPADSVKTEIQRPSMTSRECLQVFRDVID